MKNTTAEMIRSLRQERHLTQKELAEELGINPSALSNREQGTREPKIESVEMLCDYFNIDLNYFYGKSPVKNNYRDGNDVFQIPLFDLSSLKDGKINYEEIKEYIIIPKFMLIPNKSYYAVVMPDDSLLGAGLKEGDIAVFDNKKKTEINKIGLFIFNDGLYIRKLQIEYSQYYLSPLNEEYKRIPCSDPSCMGCLALVISNKQW